MGSPAAVPHLSRLSAPPAVMRVLAVFVGLHGVAHLAGTSDSFTKAADGDSVDYLAGTWTLWDPTLLRADVLLAVAVCAGDFSRAGAPR